MFNYIKNIFRCGSYGFHKKPLEETNVIDDVELHQNSFNCVLSPVHSFNDFKHSVKKYFIIQHQKGAFLKSHKVTGVSVKPNTSNWWSAMLQKSLYFFHCFPQTTVSWRVKSNSEPEITSGCWSALNLCATDTRELLQCCCGNYFSHMGQCFNQLWKSGSPTVNFIQ